MNNTTLSIPILSSSDFYYLSISSDIFLYGYITMMAIGLIGNTCQMITFSRKTMRSIGTGILFLALSISDTIYILTSLYVVMVFGFTIPDQSDYARTCRFRHYFTYVSSIFSAWMLTTISYDRWIRLKFPFKVQRICCQRAAIYSIIIALIADCLLHVHILMPMFGQIAPGVTSYCGANSFYPIYKYFYNYIWPFVTILTVSIIPAISMMFFSTEIIVTIQSRQNRIAPLRQSNSNKSEYKRLNFVHQQMLILMFVTMMLFLFTTFPNGLFRFALATTSLYQSFAFSLFISSIFEFIMLCNHSLNFYLHCLTSKLFRREFFHCSLRRK